MPRRHRRAPWHRVGTRACRGHRSTSCREQDVPRSAPVHWRDRSSELRPTPGRRADEEHTDHEPPARRRRRTAASGRGAPKPPIPPRGPVVPNAGGEGGGGAGGSASAIGRSQGGARRHRWDARGGLRRGGDRPRRDEHRPAARAIDLGIDGPSAFGQGLMGVRSDIGTRLMRSGRWRRPRRSTSLPFGRLRCRLRCRFYGSLALRLPFGRLRCRLRCRFYGSLALRPSISSGFGSPPP